MILLEHPQIGTSSLRQVRVERELIAFEDKSATGDKPTAPDFEHFYLRIFEERSMN